MSTFGAYRRNSRGAVAARLVTTTTASSASRTPTRASRTWPSACAWKVKLSCDGRVAYGFAHAGGLGRCPARRVARAPCCDAFEPLLVVLGAPMRKRGGRPSTPHPSSTPPSRAPQRELLQSGKKLFLPSTPEPRVIV